MVNKIYTFYINGALNTDARLRGQSNDEGTKVKGSGQRGAYTHVKKKSCPIFVRKADRGSSRITIYYPRH